MSYILDALKKAEAQRNMGAAPHLHAQPTYIPPAPARRPVWAGPWPWIALLTSAAALAALALLRPWDGAPRPAAPPAAPAQGASARAPAPAVPAAPAVPPVAAAPAQEAVPPKATPSKEPPPKEHSTKEPSPKEATSPHAPSSPAPSKPAKDTRPRKAARAAEPKTSGEDKPAPAESRIATVAELPENIQREIPRLIVSGYLYSSNKSDRTVLINQKLMREGDQVAPDLMLEKLTPTGMVLNYKGHRYQRSY